MEKEEYPSPPVRPIVPELVVLQCNHRAGWFGTKTTCGAEYFGAAHTTVCWTRGVLVQDAGGNQLDRSPHVVSWTAGPSPHVTRPIVRPLTLKWWPRKLLGVKPNVS